MKILVINGANINFIGIREKEVYGSVSYKNLMLQLKNEFKKKDVKLKIVQSNHEGKIIDYLQMGYLRRYDGIVINPGAYTHYSYAISDAIKSINIPIIEVHFSDITNREDFRKVSITGQFAKKIIYGKGINSYIEAIEYLIN